MPDCTATGFILRQRLTFIGGAVEGLPTIGHALARAVDRAESDIRWLSLLSRLVRYLAPDGIVEPYTLAADIAARLEHFTTAHRRIVLGHRKVQNETEELMCPIMAYKKKRSVGTLYRGVLELQNHL
jgi:hypothetical protein